MARRTEPAEQPEPAEPVLPQIAVKGENEPDPPGLAEVQFGGDAIQYPTVAARGESEPDPSTSEEAAE